MMKRRDHRAGDEPRAPGARRDRRQKDAGVRRMPAVIVEGMLDGLDAVVAERVGALREPQALGIVGRGGAVLGPEGREEVDAELHASASARRALSISDARIKKALCFAGSSAIPRNSSK